MVSAGEPDLVSIIKKSIQDLSNNANSSLNWRVKMLGASFLDIICCCIDQTVPDEPFSINS
jgi:hypothetical protein